MGGIPREIADCPLCTAIATEKAVVFRHFEVQNFDYEGVAILPTKNKKGHEYRYMVCTLKHTMDNQAELDSIAAIFLFMREFGRDFVILEPTHATVKDHWHRVASDMHGDDFLLIEKTDRIEVRLHKAGECSR